MRVVFPHTKKDVHGDAVEAYPMDVAKRVLEWRWLIIDEVSIMSARLLADMDVRLRDVVRDLDLQKGGLDGVTRPFGGLIVLFCCDFWQLDPPDGGFLGQIPDEFIRRARKYQPAPTVSHGQAPFGPRQRGYARRHRVD